MKTYFWLITFEKNSNRVPYIPFILQYILQMYPQSTVQIHKKCLILCTVPQRDSAARFFQIRFLSIICPPFRDYPDSIISNFVENSRRRCQSSEPPESTTPSTNRSPVWMIKAELGVFLSSTLAVGKKSSVLTQICIHHWCWHKWCTLSREYLSDIF
jgi:hypothetical protein